MTDHLSEQMKAGAHFISGRPDWIDAPAVQAWHRSDDRTEPDGTPGKPRIWSPDYGTTECWSTPSLQNVRWSDLVDVVPLGAPAVPDTIEALRGVINQAEEDCRKYRRELDGARARAEEAEQKLSRKAAAYDQLLGLFGDAERAALHWRARAEHPRPLTARQHLDAAWEAAPRPAADDLRKGRVIPAGTPMLVRAVSTGLLRMEVAGSNGAATATWADGSKIWERRLLDTSEPARDPEAEKLDPIIDAAIRGHSDITAPTVVHAIADALADEGVRMAGGEDR